MEPYLKSKKITSLDLSDNQILAIPESIDQLQTLQTLNLRNNNISIIPSSIANLKSLKKLYVKGNNLDSKLEETIRTKGLSGLIEYLKEDY